MATQLQTNKRSLHAGDEIQLKTKVGEFRGCLHSRTSDKVYFNNVLDLNSGLRHNGLRCFHKNDIISSKYIRGYDTTDNEVRPKIIKSNLVAIKDFVKPITHEPQNSHETHECVSNDDKSVNGESPSGDIGRIMASKMIGLKKILDMKGDSTLTSLSTDLRDNKSEGDSTLTSLSTDLKDNKSEVASKAPTIESHHRYNSDTTKPLDESHHSYVIIKSIDNVFYGSITDMKLSKSIGIAFINSNVDRHSDFSWIAVHATNVYLYDILSLGESAFKGGLKDIFEDPEIIKIVFDCRVASHTLLHRHECLITNVLDIMAFDIVAESFSHPMFGVSKTMNSLQSCISGNLDVSAFEISSQNFRLEKASKNEGYWNLRCEDKKDPLHRDYEEMIQSIIFKVVHLKCLKLSLTKKLMEPVIDATDFLLGSFRDNSNPSSAQLAHSTATPKEFHDWSVMKRAANRCRDKTAELMRTLNQNGCENKPADVTSPEDKLHQHFFETMNGKVEKENGISDLTSSAGVSSDKSLNEAKSLLSKLMLQKDRRQNNDDLSFAPAGSEIGYVHSRRGRQKY